MRFLSLLCCDANPSALMFFLSQVTPEDKGKATRLHSQDNVKDMSEAKANGMSEQQFSKNVSCVCQVQAFVQSYDAPGLPERHRKRTA